MSKKINVTCLLTNDWLMFAVFIEQGDKYVESEVKLKVLKIQVTLINWKQKFGMQIFWVN